MNTPSWQIMGLTIQSEFQAWTDQLLQGFIFPNDCIDELQTLDGLVLVVDSIGEIEAGFWELEAALTSDFLPSGEVRKLHPEASSQVVRNHTPDGSNSENLEPQSLIDPLPQGDNIANLSQPKSALKELSQGETTVLENGWNNLEESSSVSSTQSLSNRLVHRLHKESLTSSENPIHSWRSQPENLPPSNLETLSTSKIPFSQPETVTQESQFPETVKKSPKQSWITVTPVSKTSLMESTISKSQAMVSTGIESKAHSAINSVPINRSPLSEPFPPKGLGDLANLLNLSPSQALDWQEVKSEMRSTNFPSESSQKKELVMRVQSDAMSEPISETTIQAIAPICDFPSPEASIPPSLKAPELDLEEVLETVQRQVNQEYRRFYGG